MFTHVTANADRFKVSCCPGGFINIQLLDGGDSSKNNTLEVKISAPLDTPDGADDAVHIRLMTDLICKLTAARDELAATTNQPQPS